MAAVIWKKGKVLLQRQPFKGRWGGLWMFPHWIVKNGKHERQILKDCLRDEFGLAVEELTPRLVVKHGFTKYRVQLRTYDARVAQGPFVILDNSKLLTRWVNPSRFPRLPLPRPHQKIAKHLLKGVL